VSAARSRAAGPPFCGGIVDRGDADAGAHGVPGALVLDRHGHVPYETFGDPDPVHAAETGQHHGELIAAEPGDRIAVADRAGQPVRQHPQDRVTGAVPGGVVDRLEAVQVQVEHGRAGRAGVEFLAERGPAHAEEPHPDGVQRRRPPGRGGRRAGPYARWPIVHSTADTEPSSVRCSSVLIG
jgi:hypothetical protein